MDASRVGVIFSGAIAKSSVTCRNTAGGCHGRQRRKKREKTHVGAAVGVTPAFPPSGAPCSLAMHTYSLPAPCWALTKRVARSMQTIRPPVTLGSSVPECPVFSTRNMRLSHATTSCEEGLAGLSRLMTP